MPGRHTMDGVEISWRWKEKKSVKSSSNFSDDFFFRFITFDIPSPSLLRTSKPYVMRCENVVCENEIFILPIFLMEFPSTSLVLVLRRRVSVVEIKIEFIVIMTRQSLKFMIDFLAHPRRERGKKLSAINMLPNSTSGLPLSRLYWQQLTC